MLAETILTFLRQRNDWTTRKELATALKRPRKLSSHDLSVLKALTEAGLIESKMKSLGVAKWLWKYRANK